MKDRIGGRSRPGPGSTRGPVLAAWGLGVDSTGMLVELTARGEGPDAALFADTGGETEATYACLPPLRAWLEERGVAVHVVRAAPRSRNWPPYATLEENCLTNGTLPSLAFGRKGCSVKWKVEPQDRWTRSWGPAVAAWAEGRKVVKLIGYDAGPSDMRRMAAAGARDDALYEYRYPLVEMGWTRRDAAARIEAEGLPVPPKSACWFCPSSRPAEVSALPPALLRRIVLMEARAEPRNVTVEGLWRRAVAGRRGAVPHPGSMTEYIVSEGLLEAGEVDAIRAGVPKRVLDAREASEDGGELSRWAASLAACGGVRQGYGTVAPEEPARLAV